MSEETFTPPASQEDLNRLIADRLSRQKEKLEREFSDQYSDYDDLKSKAERLAELEDAEKGELQKALERADAAEAAVKAREEADAQAAQKAEAEKARSNLIAEIASEKSLSDEATAALRGTTREELEAHADLLKPLIKTPEVIPDPGETPENKPSEEAEFVRGLFGK